MMNCSLAMMVFGVSSSGLVMGVIDETGLSGNVVAIESKANGLGLRDSLRCERSEEPVAFKDFGDCSGVRV